MIQEISIAPKQVRQNTVCTLGSQEALEDFPFLVIDVDSYIVGAQMHSGINFDIAGGRHCIAIGKGCSLAENLALMIDVNHDYGAVSQGELSFLQGMKFGHTIPRKGTIIVQNDVWVGHGATIMSGVTLHNGCVVAAGAVVTKDVPPYAIVGGNPAKIIRYRFAEETIAALHKIAWWDWSQRTFGFPLRTLRKSICRKWKEG